MTDGVFYDFNPYQVPPAGSKWRQHRQIFNEIPLNIKHCLLDEGSLTQRLITASDNNFSVQVYSQGWHTPYLDESRSLDINSRHLAQVRETLLLCNGIPWVFARSVIPASSLKGHARQLLKLNNRSLGSWLFNDSTMRRAAFELATIDTNNTVVPINLQMQQTLWGRRSKFTVQGLPLLVAEIFLPAFKPWPVI
jgi:chorismate--pyruvate lyase